MPSGRRNTGRGLYLACGLLLAVLPLLPSLGWIVSQPWHTGALEDDDAIIELLTRDVARGRHFIGPYSRFHWNHPGPLFFYLASPVYFWSGEKPAAARLTPLAINAACAVGIVGLMARFFGPVAAVVAGAGVAIVAAHLGASIVASLWNPFSTIMPFALFVCLAFAASRSGGAFIPLTVTVATFLVQTHIGYLPTVAAVLGMAAAFAVHRLWGERAPPGGPGRAGRSFGTAWFLAGLGTGLLLWLPAALDQLWFTPGNATLLWQFFSTPRDGHSIVQVARTAAPNVAGVFLRLAPMVAAHYEEPAPSLAANVLLALLTLALIGVIVLAGRTDLRVFSALVLTTLVAALGAATRIVDDLHPYLFTWMCTIGLLGGIAIAALAWQSTAVLRSRAVLWTIVAVAGMTSLFALRANVRFVATMRPMEPLPYVRSLSDAIARAAGGRVPLIAMQAETWIWAAGVLNELDRRGVAFRVPKYWTFMYGKTRLGRGDEPVHLLLADANVNADFKGRPDLSLVASSDEKLVFLESKAGRAGPAPLPDAGDNPRAARGLGTSTP